MNWAYTKAIDLLMSGKLDFRSIAINLAKSNPELFVQIARDGIHSEEWHCDVIDLIKQDKNVEAIKLTRTHTGYGLKDSKDVIDVLRGKMYNAGMLGVLPCWTNVSAILDASQNLLLEKFLTAAGI